MNQSHRVFERSIRSVSILIAVAAVLMVVPLSKAQTPAPAQEKPKDQPITSQTHPNNPELWNVDAMMEDAVKQISRHYNLNKEQEDFTRLLLIKRTKDFLAVHEHDVRELLKESIDLRQGLKPGGADAFKKWAERAEPVYDAAKKAILDGNKEWRGVLNPDQQKIHDNDLALMNTNFEQVTRTLDSWKAGNGNATTLAGGRKTKKDQEKTQVGGPQNIVRLLLEDNWKSYVNRFISVYKLDEKQAIAAQEKIHKEMHEQATKYREKHKAEFEQIDQSSKSAAANMKPAELVKKRMELERPIRELFVEMNQRLMQLIDSKQIANVDPESKRQLETLYNTLAGTNMRPDAAVGKAVPVGANDPPKRADTKDEKGAKPAGSQAAESKAAVPASAPADSGSK